LGDYKRKELGTVCPANFVSLLKEEFFLSTVISVLFVVVVVVVIVVVVLCIPIFWQVFGTSSFVTE
jgi:pilus assembly protein TadC